MSPKPKIYQHPSSGNPTTAKIYAKEQGVSIVTARKRLEFGGLPPRKTYGSGKANV